MKLYSPAKNRIKQILDFLDKMKIFSQYSLSRIIMYSLLFAMTEIVTLLCIIQIIRILTGGNWIVEIPSQMETNFDVAIIVTALVLIASTGCKILFLKNQMDSIQSTRTQLTTRYVASFCNKSYTEASEVPSETRIKDATLEIDLFVERIFQPVAQLVFSSSMIFFISGGLLLFHTIETIFIISLLVMLYIFSQLLIKPIMQLSASERIKLLNSRLASLGRLFNCSDILKINNMQRQEMNKYFGLTASYNKVFSALIYLPQLPKFILENSTFVIICLLLLTFESNSQLINFLAIFAVGFYKLLPSMQLFYYSLTQFMTFFKSFIQFTNDTELKNPSVIMIQHRGHNEFEWKSEHSLAGNLLKITAEKGDRILISGKSGSGKSTLLRKLAGLENSISIILPPLAEGTYYDNIYYLDQSPKIFDGSLEENIFLGNVHDKEVLNKILKVLELQELRERSPDMVISPGSTQLSGGQKQRIGIARLLATKSRHILFLDEPTSALESTLSKRIMENIFDEFQDSVIFFITHDEKLQEMSSREINLI